MLATEHLPNEKDRLINLYSYQLFDKEDNEEFQDLVELASAICETPISLITLLNENKQLFKAKVGLTVNETPREDSFCTHAIKEPNEPFIIEDARKDDRFKDNPLVIGNPNIVFYAGVPLVSDNNLPLGTLCVIDKKPRSLNAHQLFALKTLSKQVVLLFRQRKSLLELAEKERVLEQTVKNLDNLGAMIAHDLKSAFRRIGITTEILQLKHEDALDDESNEFLNNLRKESEDSMQFTTAILRLTKSINSYQEKSEKIDVTELIEESWNRLEKGAHFTLQLPKEKIYANLPATAIRHIFENLLQNGIKYMDKEEPQLSIDYCIKKNYHCFYVKDNGPGIPEEDQASIFEIFNRGKNNVNEAIPGTGIGLAIVQKITNLLGGEVKVTSTMGEGTTFQLALPFIT